MKKEIETDGVPLSSIGVLVAAAIPLLWAIALSNMWW